MRRARRGVAALAAAAVLATTAGCGSDAPTPAQQVPAVGRILTNAEEALAEQDYETARSQLERLQRVVEQAVADGDLDEGQAQDVLDAAAVLLAALPDDATELPTDEPTDAPTDEPTEEPSDEPTEEESDEEEPDEEEPEESEEDQGDEEDEPGPPGGDGPPGKPDKDDKPGKPEKPGKGPKGR